MFPKATRNIKRALAIIRFGLLILRWCGIRLFLSQLAHQLYGRTVFLVTIDELEKARLLSDFQCTVKLASPDDIKELFDGLRTENPEGRYQLLVRKWYHERGFGDCYITRASDTNEICVVRWMVTPEHVKQYGWEDRFPLNEDEIMLENVYTFERYRREGARAASNFQVKQIALQLGHKRTRGYSDETNIPQLTWGEKAGNKVYAKILERHFLFHVTRETLETYNPPILMKAPVNSR